MILLCKLAAAAFVATVLTLLLKKDQPAFAFLVSACTAAGLLAVVVQQVGPWLDWLRTLDVYFQGQSPAVLLRVLVLYFFMVFLSTALCCWQGMEVLDDFAASFSAGVLCDLSIGGDAAALLAGKRL